MKTTQNQRILNYLKEFGSITQLEALKDLGIMRLASRISELRAMGTKIVGGFEKVENRYGEEVLIKRYSLAKD